MCPTAWLTIIGLGEKGQRELGESARTALAQAALVVGSRRHLQLVNVDEHCECLTWPSPFNALIDVLKARRGQKVCVLATGDPFCYGIGNVLARHFRADELNTYPQPSAFSLACARLGWNVSQTQMISLHGRPLALLYMHLQPQAQLLVLTANERGPRQIAQALVERGFGSSRITVLNQMSGDEWHDVCIAADFAIEKISNRNTVAIECIADRDTRWHSIAPGLADDAFHHDGQLTKRIVRAATVSGLSPVAGHVLWDVGAGAGSVAIEWLRLAPDTQAFAIERSFDRSELIRRNAIELGVPALTVVLGNAPEALQELPDPDAILIGGSVANTALFDYCWQRLRTNGRLVANAVTLEAEAELFARHGALGGELARIGTAYAQPIGSQRSFSPRRTVTQWIRCKR